MEEERADVEENVVSVMGSNSNSNSKESFDATFAILVSTASGHGATPQNTPLTVAVDKKPDTNSSNAKEIFDSIQQYKDSHSYYFQPAGYDGCTIYDNVPGSKNSRENKYKDIVDSTFANLEQANLCKTSTKSEGDRDYHTGAYRYFNAVAKSTKERWGNTNKEDQKYDSRKTFETQIGVIESYTGKKTSKETKDTLFDSISESSGANIIKPLKDELFMTFSGKANEKVREGIPGFINLSKKLLGKSSKPKFDSKNQLDILTHVNKFNPNEDQQSLAEMYRKYGNDSLSGFLAIFGAFCKPNGDTIMVKSRDGFAINELKNWFEIRQRFQMCHILGQPGSLERIQSLSEMTNLPDRNNWDEDNLKLDKMIREILKKTEKNAWVIYGMKPMYENLYTYSVPEMINSTEYSKDPNVLINAHKIRGEQKNTTALSDIIITKMTTTVSTMLNLLLIIFLKHCVFEMEFDISRYFDYKEDGREYAKLDFFKLLCDDGNNSRQFSILDICSTHFDVSSSRLPYNDLRKAEQYLRTNLRGDNVVTTGTMVVDLDTGDAIKDEKETSKKGRNIVRKNFPDVGNMGPMSPESDDSNDSDDLDDSIIKWRTGRQNKSDSDSDSDSQSTEFESLFPMENRGAKISASSSYNPEHSTVQISHNKLYRKGLDRVAKEIADNERKKSSLLGFPRLRSEVESDSDEDPFAEVKERRKIAESKKELGNSKGGRSTARCNKGKSQRVNNAKKYTKKQGKRLTIRQKSKSSKTLRKRRTIKKRRTNKKRR
jgi:hypothetical protein